MKSDQLRKGAWPRKSTKLPSHIRVAFYAALLPRRKAASRPRRFTRSFTSPRDVGAKPLRPQPPVRRSLARRRINQRLSTLPRRAIQPLPQAACEQLPTKTGRSSDSKKENCRSESQKSGPHCRANLNIHVIAISFVSHERVRNFG